jgi:hypothetical protein
MSSAEDEYAVGDFGAGGEHEPFRVGVGSRASWWDLAHSDADVGQYRVEGGGELSGPVADEDGEPVCAFAWSRRTGAGGMPSRLRIRRMVDALTWWPRPSSSPWMRW